MRVEAFNSQGLLGFINSESFKRLKNLPISKHRAVAHVNNPRAKSDDILLVCAFNEYDEVVGYMGLLPDKFHFPSVVRRTAWISTIWIHPETRGKGIANLLLDASFKAWNGEISATGFTATAKKLYDKYGEFCDLKLQEGHRVYLRFNIQDLAKVKFANNVVVAGLSKLLDSALNLFNDLQLSYKLKNALDEFEIEYLTEIDNESTIFIETENKKELSRRGPEDLNWMARFPWVLTTPGADVNSIRYFFSYSDNRFEVLFIKISNKLTKNIVCFIVVEIRGSKMKLPYVYGASRIAEKFHYIVFNIMLKRKVAMLTIFNPSVAELVLRGKSKVLFKKPFSRLYIVSKAYQSNLREFSSTDDFVLQDGDSDGAFI